MSPAAICWGVRLEHEDEAMALPLWRVLDVAAGADRWREITAWSLDVGSVSFELGAGETTADALEAAEQDLAIEDLCFDSVAHEALARVAVKAMRAELERPTA